MNIFPDLLCAVPLVSLVYGETVQRTAFPYHENNTYTKDDITVSIQKINQAWSVSLTADQTPVSWIILRFPLHFPADIRVYGDDWERGYGNLHWGGISPERHMPWYFLCYDGNTGTTAGYGVRVRPNAMCVWHADGEGVTLYLDVRSGGMGVILGGRTLGAAEIICREYTDTDAFSAGHSFCREMCTDPIFPKEPVYGSNNWYYAYGKSSHDEILSDSVYIAELCEGLENRPYMVIDDGWQDHPTAGPWDHGNEHFGDMGVLAGEMKAHNIKPGIWIRFLCDKDPSIPAEWKSLRESEYLDPSVDAVLDHVRTTARRLVDWGYMLIKHDYSTYDIFGHYGMHMGTSVTENNWHFRDRSKTSAEVVLNFYRAIREGAGDAVIIGCNTLSHLCAGLVEVNRTGDDTSGRYWDRTRKMGVNTLAFRMMQNRAFYMADADCIGITDMVPWEQNRVWLKALSRSGSPLFMSSAKGVANDEMIAEIREAFRYNAVQEDVLVPVDWLYNLCPGDWLLNGQKLHLCWYPENGYDALDPIGNMI